MTEIERERDALVDQWIATWQEPSDWSDDTRTYVIGNLRGFVEWLTAHGYLK